jgi:ADP-heptose:LPS heptosyltransferase
VIDFFSNPRSALMSFLTGAPHRIAAYHPGRSWWYTYAPKIQGGIGYAAEDKLALLHAIGIHGQLGPPVIQLAKDAQKYIEVFFTEQNIRTNVKEKSCESSESFAQLSHSPIITIDPTSRRQAKRWIPERYVQLADRLVEKYAATVIFIWGPGEKDMVTDLVKQGNYPHVLACPTDLMQLAALIAKSDLHIGNCSAPRHIAVAVGTPSLTIMGSTIPENWTYPSPIHRFVRGKVPCLECQKTECQTHECMKALTVQEIENAVEELIIDA